MAKFEFQILLCNGGFCFWSLEREMKESEFDSEIVFSMLTTDVVIYIYLLLFFYGCIVESELLSLSFLIDKIKYLFSNNSNISIIKSNPFSTVALNSSRKNIDWIKFCSIEIYKMFFKKNYKYKLLYFKYKIGFKCLSRKICI